MFRIFKKSYRIVVMSIRSRVRAWLGLDDVPSIAMYKALNLAAQERHNAMMEVLQRIENLLIARPVTQTQTIDYSPQVLDWDLIQAIGLAELNNDIKNQKDN